MVRAVKTIQNVSKKSEAEFNKSAHLKILGDLEISRKDNLNLKRKIAGFEQEIEELSRKLVAKSSPRADAAKERASIADLNKQINYHKQDAEAQHKLNESLTKRNHTLIDHERENFDLHASNKVLIEAIKCLCMGLVK